MYIYVYIYIYIYIYIYTANSKKVALSLKNLKPFNSKRASDDGCCYSEPRSGQFTLVNKQIYTLSVFIICPSCNVKFLSFRL